MDSNGLLMGLYIWYRYIEHPHLWIFANGYSWWPNPPAIEAEDILLRILHHEFLQVIHVRLLETAKLLSITAGDVLFEKQWWYPKTCIIQLTCYYIYNVNVTIHIMSCDHGLRAAQHLFIQNVRSIYIRHWSYWSNSNICHKYKPGWWLIYG